MVLQLFNSKTRKIEGFKPLKGKEIKIYSCGPTVYDYAHIGNFRNFVWTDLLRRYLKYSGFRVQQVMNITNVDDKTIKRSRADKVPLKKVTETFSKAFFEDCEALNIEKVEIFCKATEHIDDMVTLVKILLEKGLAYKADDGVYYKISGYKEYGKLVRLKGLEAGKSGRVKADEYDKENVKDFVLWKAWDKDDGDVFWKTDLGKGRPGWHIECSAMSMKYLGESFDIHTGGIDLKFPHHENELAQSKGASGKDLAKYWLHSEHLVVDGKKMAKSAGNFYTLRDVLKKEYSPKAVRYLLMATHYRQKLNFTFEALKGAENALQSFYDFLDRLNKMNGKKDGQVVGLIKETKKEFEQYMDDDLQISGALAALFDLMKAVNKLGELSKKDADKLKQFFCKIDGVIGVLGHEEVEIPAEIQNLVDKREEARGKKKFDAADSIRKQIEKKGFILEDISKGVRIKKK